MKGSFEKGSRRMAVALLAAYLVLLVYLLFFSEEMGRTQSHGYSYNLVLFDEIKRFLVHWRVIGIKRVLINLAGNVLAFVPFGILIPMIVKKERNALCLTATAFLFSLLVEVTQLLSQRGSFDVDDLLLNTLGGLIGYGIYLVIRMRWRKRGNAE